MAQIEKSHREEANRSVAESERPGVEEASPAVAVWFHSVLMAQVQKLTTELAQSKAALQTEIRERPQAEKVMRDQVEAFTKTLQLLVTEPERDRFIGQVLKAIIEQLGAHSGEFWLYDSIRGINFQRLDYSEGRIQVTPSPNPLLTVGGGLRKVYEPLSGMEELTQGRVLTLYDDIAHDPRLARCRDDFLSQGIHALVLIPLFLEEEFLGCFSVHSAQSRSYQPSEIELAQAFAQQAALAVQLARKAEQNRLAAILEERNRLAREIHDTLAQAFTGMLIQLGVAQRIAKRQPEEAWNLVEHVEDLARQGLAEARRSVWALQPEALEYSNLADSLPRIVAQMTADTPVHAEALVRGVPRLLPADVGMNLLRIGQEALNNALRHAHAQKIFVELTFDAEQVRLCVQDDGQGFDPQHQEEGGGFGLIGMRQRAKRIEGHLTITSQPGQGAEVAVIAPIAPA